MKLPNSKEDGKRMMMMSGASTGRKGISCEHRETSLVGKHDVQGFQYKTNMDLGSGDTSDFYASNTDIQNNYDLYNWDTRFDSHDFSVAQSAIAKTHVSVSASPPLPPSPPQPLPPPTPLEKVESSSSESLNKNTLQEQLSGNRSSEDNSFKTRDYESFEARNSTLPVVEDGKEPNFTANESNPTVPAPTEPSKTSTLRLSDRTRSESEDDIEKMDEPEQEGTLIGHKTLYKTTATTDNTPNSDKTDKNGNRSDLEENDNESDCVVQCLYYTIQCCECVIS